MPLPDSPLASEALSFLLFLAQTSHFQGGLKGSRQTASQTADNVLIKELDCNTSGELLSSLFVGVCVAF